MPNSVITHASHVPPVPPAVPPPAARPWWARLRDRMRAVYEAELVREALMPGWDHLPAEAPFLKFGLPLAAVTPIVGLLTGTGLIAQGRPVAALFQFAFSWLFWGLLGSLFWRRPAPDGAPPTPWWGPLLRPSVWQFAIPATLVSAYVRLLPSSAPEAGSILSVAFLEQAPGMLVSYTLVGELLLAGRWQRLRERALAAFRWREASALVGSGAAPPTVPPDRTRPPPRLEPAAP